MLTKNLLNPSMKTLSLCFVFWGCQSGSTSSPNPNKKSSATANQDNQTVATDPNAPAFSSINDLQVVQGGSVTGQFSVSSPVQGRSVANVQGASSSAALSLSAITIGADGKGSFLVTAATNTAGQKIPVMLRATDNTGSINTTTFNVIVTDGSSGGNSGTNSGTNSNTTQTSNRSSCKDTLNVGESLSTDQKLCSTDGRYTFSMQNDGNLVLYRSGVKDACWASSSSGTSASLLLQSDGNLVVYASNSAKWASNTNGQTAQKLVLQNDGNIVLYASDNHAIWSTNTYETGANPCGASSGSSSLQGQPVPLYRLTNNRTFMLSLNPNEEVSTGFHSLGTIGKLMSSQVDGTTLLYRCQMNSPSPSLFVSTNSTCDGQVVKAQLGYIFTSQTANATVGLYQCKGLAGNFEGMTRDECAQKQGGFNYFENTLGYLLP